MAGVNRQKVVSQIFSRFAHMPKDQQLAAQDQAIKEARKVLQMYHLVLTEDGEIIQVPKHPDEVNKSDI